MRSLDSSTAYSVPPLVRILIAVDIILCLLYIMNLMLGQPSSKLTAMLDLNGENSIPAWYSSMQYFLAFLLSSVYVKKSGRQNSGMILLLLLPAMFLLMSVDESVMIHEWLGRRTDILLPGGDRAGTLFQQTGIWTIVVGVPFLFLFLFWARAIRKHLPKRSVSKLVLGLCIMLSGGLGCEFISNFIAESFIMTEIIFEEGLEMIGATVMLWAVHDLAARYLHVLAPANDPSITRNFASNLVTPAE